MKMCNKNCFKVFSECGVFVSITDPEGGTTVTIMILKGGTAKKKCLNFHEMQHSHDQDNILIVTVIRMTHRSCHR